jgi:hypothetical protein
VNGEELVRLLPKIVGQLLGLLDKMAFDALSGFTDVASTKELPQPNGNIYYCYKEFALAHEKRGWLSQTYIANNQLNCMIHFGLLEHRGCR